MDFHRCRLPENLLDNFDRNLQLFYRNVLKKELKLSDPTGIVKVKKAFKEVVHAYKKETVDSLSSSILFDSKEKRYAYIMKHCPCFTSAVARHFFRFLQLNPYILYAAIHQRRLLNICCLGGGPATDAVALAKIVNSLNTCFFNVYRSKLEFRVSLIDLSEDWKTTSRKVMQTVENTPGFCDREKMFINFEFLQADLTEEWAEEVKKSISVADVLTLVYFVSAVNGSKVKNKCCSMLQNIMNSLKPGAMLFFLDSSKSIHFESILSAASIVRNVKPIYGPNIQEFHTLSMRSIKTFIELYSQQFNASMCLSNCFVSSCVWIKEQATLPLKFSIGRNNFDSKKLEISANIFTNRSTNSFRKKVTYYNKKQQCFLLKLEKLFLRNNQMDFDVEDLVESFEDSFETENWICGTKILYPTKLKRRRMLARFDGEIVYMR